MTWLSLDDAVADVRQLLTLLTESHPDPYTNAGGVIALHRRVATLLRTIPDGGISRADLLRLLRPLVASLCDGHTFLFESGAEPGSSEPEPVRVLPIAFDPLDGRLSVGAVYREEDRRLLGGVLEAVEGVPFRELSCRMAGMRGADNEYTNLVHLADAIVDPAMAVDLLHRQTPLQSVSLDLRLREGMESIDLPVECAGADPIEGPSDLQLPPLTPSDLGWGFLTEDRSVACLRVASLVRYREAFEISRALGHARFLETYLADVALAATDGGDPADIDDVVAAVPSAAEQLDDLFREMRLAGTKRLIVDLRDNGGGNSFFSAILGYFLYGMDGLLAMDWGYQIPRYSPLYLANYLSPSEDKQLAIDASLMNDGYDFSEEIEWERRRNGGPQPGGSDVLLEIAHAPSFARIVARDTSPAVLPLDVVAVTSARTYSAAFDVAAMLTKGGASLVGVPSSQAGNCFIDGLFFTLDHSQLTGIISYKRSYLFPGEPERGTLLRPHCELTYDYLASVAFDRNAAIKLALEYSA